MSTLYYESSFAHHGVKGQKWGVRRYQNPDGSLTNTGRKHLLELQKMDRDTYRKESEESKDVIKTHVKNTEEFLDAYDRLKDSTNKLEDLENKMSVIRTDKKLRREEATEYAWRFHINALDYAPSAKEIDSIIDYYMNGEGSSEMESNWADTTWGIAPPGKTVSQYQLDLYVNMRRASEDMASVMLKQIGGTKIDTIRGTNFDSDIVDLMTKTMANHALSDSYLEKYRNKKLISG